MQIYGTSLKTGNADKISKTDHKKICIEPTKKKKGIPN